MTTKDRDESRSAEEVRWLHGLFAAVGVLCLAGAAAWMGAYPVRIFWHDTLFLLDNTWRELSGQVVHVDYQSPWGPLMFMVEAVGLRLAGGSVHGLGYANALIGLAVGGWAWWLGRRRLEPWVAVAMAWLVTALVVAPYALGWGVHRTTFAMIYNRDGYALLMLILLECFAPVSSPDEGRERTLGAFSTGALVALLLFLKISYFLVGVFVVGVGLVFVGGDRRRILAGLAGFGVVFVAVLAHLRFDLFAMLGDLRAAAGAKSESLSRTLFLERFRDTGYMVILYVWLGGRARVAAAGERWPPLLPLGVTCLVADFALLYTNQQPKQLPLSALFGLFLVNEAVRQRRRGEGVGSGLRTEVVLACGAMLYALQFGLDVGGVAVGVHASGQPVDETKVVRFTSPKLRDAVFADGFGGPEGQARSYVTQLNDGEALLRANKRPGESVLNIDMFNPFPYVLDEPPPRAGIAAAAYRYTLSDSFHPSDDDFFGDADLVTVPKDLVTEDLMWTGFYDLYEPALKSRFHVVDESERWILYRRNEAGQAVGSPAE